MFKKRLWWSPLLWTPASTAAIVWIMLRYAPGAAGSGIPQLMAALTPEVTQAPLTAFIIVMEMVDGHALVLSLMASALVASSVSRLISAPLYASLAELELLRLPMRLT